MARRNLIIGFVILFLFLGIGLLAVLAFFSAGGSSGWAESDGALFAVGSKVAVVDVTGVIYSAADVVRQLKKYEEDGSVKAVLLRIDSPGGVVAPSQEIYEQVAATRDKKPVVASMGSVAASGGYYIACGADSIVANPGTLTGSIGVIFEYPVFGELFKKVGIQMEVVKSGELKDVGSASRPLTPRERQMLQAVINDTYEQFVEVVAKNRHLERPKVLALADGSIFTGRQAKENGLVDKLGTFDDALRLAGKMGGISGEPKTVKEKKYRRRSMFDLASEELFGKTLGLAEDWKEMFSPGLKYLYKI